MNQIKNNQSSGFNLKAERFIEDIKKNLIIFLNTTKKIDSDYADEIESLIFQLENEGLNPNTLINAKKMALVIDNKVNAKTFEIRQSKMDMLNALGKISKKDISQKQKNIIENIQLGLKQGEEHSFLNDITDVLGDFSKDVEFYREKSEKIVGEDHKHFKDGTQNILAGDIGRVSKSLTRDVFNLSKQLSQSYPSDSHVQHLFEESKKLYESKETQFFAVTDIFSRLAQYAIKLQKNEKLQSQQYLYDINNKLKTVFQTLQTTHAICNEGEDLTTNFNSNIQKGLKDFKTASDSVSDINRLHEIIGENLFSLETQVEEYTSKQKLIQRKQRRHIDGLETSLEKAIQKQKKLEDSLSEEKEASAIDELTQVPNRKGYIEYLTKVHEQWLKKKTPLSIIVLDIDKFKSINDSFGHAVGDAALKNVASIIHKYLGDRFFFARYGGEEFVLVCPLLNKSKASLLSEKIRQKIASTKFQVGKPENRQLLKITCSFGVCEFSNLLTDTSEVFEFADKALYHAKSSGRNCVCLYHEKGFYNYTKNFSKTK